MKEQMIENTAKRVPPPANANILGTQPNLAMQEMIKISRKLVSLAEQETQKLVQNDLLGFAILQDEKNSMAQRYMQASKEFRTRINEFRSVDQNLLENLNGLQKDLAEKTQANNTIVKRMREQARASTQQTLFTAQELAQTKLVRFKNDMEKLAQNSHQISKEDETNTTKE